MSRTRAELVNQVLSRLGARSIGETLTTGHEDYDFVDDELDSLVAEMNARGIFYAADLDEIEDASFHPLATYMANRLADQFGLSEGDAAKLSSRAEVAERILRRLRADETAGDRVRAEYF